MKQHTAWTWTTGVLCLFVNAFLLSLAHASPDDDEGLLYGVESQQLFPAGVELDFNSDVGDGASTNSFGPWSYRPVCTQALDALGNEPLCVYTNASFSDGRGISIFTTPQVAAEFAALLPFQDPTVLARKNINTMTRGWYSQALPGKGIGAIAKKDFRRGDLVMAHTPLLLAHGENILTTPDRERFLRIAIDQLPQPSQALFLDLAKIYNEPSIIVQDVVKANAFEIQLGNRMHLAVFPETARMNHDCGPNAQYVLDSSLIAHVTRAARPISAGEEITVSYQNPFEPTSTRQSHLRSAFHFSCTCPRCRNSERSDRNLGEISTLRSTLNHWDTTISSSSSSSSDEENNLITENAEQLINIYKEERLEAFIDQAYALAALTYNSMGNAEEAKRYAALAAATVVIRLGGGAEEEDLRHSRMISADPEGHWSWRRRVKE